MKLSHWLSSLLFFFVTCNLAHAQADASSSNKYSPGTQDLSGSHVLFLVIYM